MSETRNPKQWLETIRQANDFRNSLVFCTRQRFDRALRPKTRDGMTIDYPDAFYHITGDDLRRAIAECGIGNADTGGK